MIADRIVTNAQLWLPEPSAATAVAWADQTILAVGTNEEVLEYRGASTLVTDAGGAALLPGFHDAHIHAQSGGIALTGCDLDAEHSLEGYRRLIEEYAASHDDEWVTGSGWFGDVFAGGFPHRELLDDILGERAAVFTSHDAHGIWVNTAALTRAGIDDETRDPAAGRIVRDESGHATGMLIDTAGELVTRLLPEPDQASLRSALLAAQERLFSLGVTAWHDAILGEYLTLPDCIPAYLETISDGSLRARVTGSVWWPIEAGVSFVPEMIARVRELREAGMAVNSVKIMQDGICENCTAALIAPYTGVNPEQRGDSVIEPRVLHEITAALDAAGLSVHFHGVGDRAVRECLDAVAYARKRNGPGQAHQIAHLDVVDEQDIARFADLGVTANLQPLWARNDQEILERKLPLIGEGRFGWHFPFGSLHRAGAHLAMGSDWPVTSPDPLWGLHTATQRTAPLADKHALNPESRVAAQPEQRLDVATALRAYTLGSAEISGNAAMIGSLEPGKLADLVVLSGAIDGAHSFDELRVTETILGGQTVYLAE
ncbi:MAG: amidohydrolase [Microbacteriaceae bacterium]